MKTLYYTQTLESKSGNYREKQFGSKSEAKKDAQTFYKENNKDRYSNNKLPVFIVEHKHIETYEDGKFKKGIDK